MPELPEVETMVRGLRPALVDQTFAAIQVHDPFLLQGCSADEFERRVGGASVRLVDRRGKWVVIGLLDGRGSIVIQPRMTGGFWLIPPDRPEHIRVTFGMQGGDRSVWFCDARRLGKVAWYPDDPSAEAAFARSHGPDALKIEAEELARRLSRTSRGIKPTLMDQKVLAGIGNIYADEVLFRSRLHPERPASSLKQAEVARLHQSIGEVLAAAILAEGSSFDAGYRTVLGLEGGFLAQNAMYGRGGETLSRLLDAHPQSQDCWAGREADPLLPRLPTSQALQGWQDPPLINRPRSRTHRPVPTYVRTSLLFTWELRLLIVRQSIWAILE